MIPEQELREMYHDEKMSTREISDEFNVCHRSILNWMKKYGIESRTNLKSRLINSIKPSKKDLEKMYLSNKMPQIEISEIFNVDQSTISLWMQSYNIKPRTQLESRLDNSIKPSKDELEKMYCVMKMSSIEIGNEIGVTHATILYWMRQYGIESRMHSELVGEISSNWQGGISFEPYCQKFNNTFKSAVRKRDGYTCQLCGYKQKSSDQKLSVHHIHYDKDNCWPDVVALCRSCNSRVNSDRDYWEEYFENELITRGLLCWSISQET